MLTLSDATQFPGELHSGEYTATEGDEPSYFDNNSNTYKSTDMIQTLGSPIRNWLKDDQQHLESCYIGPEITPLERQFLWAVERGDSGTVRRLLAYAGRVNSRFQPMESSPNSLGLSRLSYQDQPPIAESAMFSARKQRLCKSSGSVRFDKSVDLDLEQRSQFGQMTKGSDEKLPLAEEEEEENYEVNDGSFNVNATKIWSFENAVEKLMEKQEADLAADQACYIADLNYLASAFQKRSSSTKTYSATQESQMGKF
ncbi:unnamed protein product [Protopolystoma xenopodis]|uniref:Uncharacterized protein n=1 Tax=Protopolystoma xenopodis TaxID=117903 RepID=A0A3S5AS41_9PLAT|nr:unnamed protein product [Protopolystoma xenopodis]